jgi:hypothetical protein
MTDSDGLGRAIAGSEAVFVMLPPLFDPSPGFPEAKGQIDSLYRSTPTIGGKANRCSFDDWRPLTRPNLLNGLHMMEESFSQLPMPVAFLRPGWFMENHAGDVNSAISEGIIYSYLQPIEHAIPMIATKDSRVTERIRVFLQSDAELFDALSRAQESPRSIQPLLAAAKKLAQKCFSAHAQGSRQLLRASLRNVLIYDDRIEILLGSTELRQNTQRQSGRRFDRRTREKPSRSRGRDLFNRSCKTDAT